ncbi:hypothetical protein DFJ73DRAFT_759383 [Zopfochytrium polystomum]|nr:hypothetical protein DFJ73DRAFT_759383 [Zopfochytrium polystomum]
MLQISPTPLKPFNIALLITRTMSSSPLPLPPNGRTMDATTLQIFPRPLKPSNSVSLIAMLQGSETNSHAYQTKQKLLSLLPAQLASYVGAGLRDRVRPLIRQAGDLFDRAYPVLQGQILEYQKGKTSMTLLDAVAKLNEFFQSEGLDWSVWKYCFNLLPFGEAENVDSSNNQYFIAAWLAIEEVLQFMGSQTMKLGVNSQLSQFTAAEEPTYHTGTFLKFTSAALHRLDEMKDAMELIVFTSLVLEICGMDTRVYGNQWIQTLFGEQRTYVLLEIQAIGFQGGKVVDSCFSNQNSAYVKSVSDWSPKRTVCEDGDDVLFNTPSKEDSIGVFPGRPPLSAILTSFGAKLKDVHLIRILSKVGNNWSPLQLISNVDRTDDNQLLQHLCWLLEDSAFPTKADDSTAAPSADSALAGSSMANAPSQIASSTDCFNKFSGVPQATPAAAVPNQPSNPPIDMKKASASEQAAEKQIPEQPSNQPFPRRLFRQLPAKRHSFGFSQGGFGKNSAAAERKKDQLDGEDALSITSMTKRAAEFPSIEAELEDDEESCWRTSSLGQDVAWQSFTLKSRTQTLMTLLQRASLN